MIADGVVLDTSVLLNILGTGKAQTILAAIQGRRVIVSVTSREVLRHPLDPLAVDPVGPLVAAGLVERVQLPDPARTRFVALVSASPPDDLDDGEAAALAVGEALGIPVAIDERKGRRLARERIPSLPLLSSGEILADDAVAAALGAGLADAVFSALVNARMRILPEQEVWVHTLLGAERASQCPSLRKRPR